MGLLMRALSRKYRWYEPVAANVVFLVIPLGKFVEEQLAEADLDTSITQASRWKRATAIAGVRVAHLCLAAFTSGLTFYLLAMKMKREILVWDPLAEELFDDLEEFHASNRIEGLPMKRGKELLLGSWVFQTVTGKPPEGREDKAIAGITGRCIFASMTLHWGSDWLSDARGSDP